jgi:CDP-glucose 4,6-dehydratase
VTSGEDGARNGAGRARGGVDPAFWRDRRVLLTGHTGFKGAWLALWLQSLGARVTGFSTGRRSVPSLFEQARVGEAMRSIDGDVRDPGAVAAALASSAPEVVIHMAAQALVRRSYAEPRETYETNVMGTVNMLDAVRLRGGEVRVLVTVTSDTRYETLEPDGTPVPNGASGGHDPYSSSKNCAELATDAFRRSFFSDPAGTRVATAASGNVIGGGDWAAHRLVPDIMRAALAGDTVRVRNPGSVRPWQHVLNPLSGYLVLAQALWDSPAYARGGWSFGPPAAEARSVGWLVSRMSELWPGQIAWSLHDRSRHTEPSLLRLDPSRARAHLGWRPLLGLDQALSSTVEWYLALEAEGDMRDVTLAQIEDVQCATPAL